MLNRAARIFFFVLMPVCALAIPKEKVTTKFEVVNVKTRIHGSSSGNLFTYTNLMFALVNGKRVVYECAQRGDVCPVLESGKTYTGDQEGGFLYVPTSFPNGTKDLSVKFKQVGNW